MIFNFMSYKNPMKVLYYLGFVLSYSQDKISKLYHAIAINNGSDPLLSRSIPLKIDSQMLKNKAFLLQP